MDSGLPRKGWDFSTVTLRIFAPPLKWEVLGFNKAPVRYAQPPLFVTKTQSEDLFRSHQGAKARRSMSFSKSRNCVGKLTVSVILNTVSIISWHCQLLSAANLEAFLSGPVVNL